jgi:hypothetical protein
VTVYSWESLFKWDLLGVWLAAGRYVVESTLESELLLIAQHLDVQPYSLFKRDYLVSRFYIWLAPNKVSISKVGGASFCESILEKHGAMSTKSIRALAVGEAGASSNSGNIKPKLTRTAGGAGSTASAVFATTQPPRKST